MLKVIVPTLNASKDWPQFASALLTSVRPEQVLIADSESNDATVELAHAAGFQVSLIKRAEFNHGGTRQKAAEIVSDAELLVYMTQDAVLANPGALASLMRPFEDEGVGAVYGRQLPREGAGPIEAHARSFNYPAVSEIRTVESARDRGFKAIFFSNSFGAYRRKALEDVGGFPLDVNFGEDTVVAGRLLLAGWKVAYAADAEVYHSHGYTIGEEFRRYVHVGELHAAHPWMIEKFGGATGEGIRYVKS
jgi:rhamnosyltransferase